MNARLYDPVLGRMISPDNFVTGAFASQAYNRYSYANNNPLKYTDPSGNNPVLIAMAIAAAINIGYQVMYNEGFNNFNVESLVLSMIQGAISAGMAGGIGDLIKPLTGFTKLAAGIGLHALSGGLQAAVFGGNVWQGAISGASKLLGRATDDLGLLGYFVTGGGTSAAVAYATGGDPMQAFIIGGATAAFNSFLHKSNTTVAGIYGAGGENASGNPDLKALVERHGGRMFSSSIGGGDDEIIAYLKAGVDKGNALKIYGHSRGGAAAVRIVNKLAAMNITVTEVNLYDPVGMYFGGDLVFEHPNVLKVNNYYQRNPIDGILLWADNPFIGSPVRGNFQWPEINNVNLTGHYYKHGVLMNHLNITEYAIKHP